MSGWPTKEGVLMGLMDKVTAGLERAAQEADKAFDKGMLTLDDDFRVVLAPRIVRSDEPFIRDVLQPLAGKQIGLPERFVPDRSFLATHRELVFVAD